jgi:hypothetical protein
MDVGADLARADVELDVDLGPLLRLVDRSFTYCEIIPAAGAVSAPFAIGSAGVRASSAMAGPNPVSEEAVAQAPPEGARTSSGGNRFQRPRV